MADLLDEVPYDDPLIDGDDVAAEGATDSVGMRQHLEAAGLPVDTMAAGDSGEVPLEEARQQLRDARSALTAMGYDLSGGADRAAGADAGTSPELRAAVSQFQEEHELEVTGHLDPETYEALMAGYEQAVETGHNADDADDFDPMPGPHG